MQWITRERPKITAPEFLFVPVEQVFVIARRTGATPYDIPGAELSHEGELCSFDAFLKRFRPMECL